MNKEEIRFAGENEIRNRWNKDAVFMNVLYFNKGEQIFPEDEQIFSDNKQIVPEDELLTGEISAVIRKIGCYSVRMSWRAYVYKDNQIIPADKKNIKIVREILNRDCLCLNLPKGLSVKYEISAKHINSPVKDYLYIYDIPINPLCMPFTGICLVKENKSIPDEYTSLLVYDRYINSSFSVDTWYKLAPTGKREYLSLHDLDPDIDKCTFVEY